MLEREVPDLPESPRPRPLLEHSSGRISLFPKPRRSPNFNSPARGRSSGPECSPHLSLVPQALPPKTSPLDNLGSGDDGDLTTFDV